MRSNPTQPPPPEDRGRSPSETAWQLNAAMERLAGTVERLNDVHANYLIQLQTAPQLNAYQAQALEAQTSAGYIQTVSGLAGAGVGAGIGALLHNPLLGAASGTAVGSTIGAFLASDQMVQAAHLQAVSNVANMTAITGYLGGNPTMGPDYTRQVVGMSPSIQAAQGIAGLQAGAALSSTLTLSNASAQFLYGRTYSPEMTTGNTQQASMMAEGLMGLQGQLMPDVYRQSPEEFLALENRKTTQVTGPQVSLDEFVKNAPAEMKKRAYEAALSIDPTHKGEARWLSNLSPADLQNEREKGYDQTTRNMANAIADLYKTERKSSNLAGTPQTYGDDPEWARRMATIYGPQFTENLKKAGLSTSTELAGADEGRSDYLAMEMQRAQYGAQAVGLSSQAEAMQYNRAASMDYGGQAEKLRGAGAAIGNEIAVLNRRLEQFGDPSSIYNEDGSVKENQAMQAARYEQTQAEIGAKQAAQGQYNYSAAMREYSGAGVGVATQMATGNAALEYGVQFGGGTQAISRGYDAMASGIRQDIERNNKLLDQTGLPADQEASIRARNIELMEREAIIRAQGIQAIDRYNTSITTANASSAASNQMIAQMQGVGGAAIMPYAAVTAQEAAGRVQGLQKELTDMGEAIRARGGDPERDNAYTTKRAEVRAAGVTAQGAQTAQADQGYSLGAQRGVAEAEYAADVFRMTPTAYGNWRGAQRGRMAAYEQERGELDAQERGLRESQGGQLSDPQSFRFEQRRMELGRHQLEAFNELSYGWQSRLESHLVNAPGNAGGMMPFVSTMAAVTGGGAMGPQFGSRSAEMPSFIKDAMTAIGAGSSGHFTGGAVGGGVGTVRLDGPIEIILRDRDANGNPRDRRGTIQPDNSNSKSGAGQTIANPYSSGPKPGKGG